MMKPTKWFIFCQSELVLTLDHQIPCSEHPPLPLEPWHTQHPLPPLAEYACVAVRIDRPVTKESGLTQVGLRASFDLLPTADYRMAGKAHELLYWDQNTKYCGVCGAPMKKDSDISKKCTNCGKQVWPSPSLAIIVLIQRPSPHGREEDEVLLVQGRNFPADFYGLVSGFVETGESLEEAIVREVKEETGIEVCNIQYQASQPWPFPSVIMAGFIADYAGGELKLQKSELKKGGWFKRNALPPLPGKVSLARKIIDAWLISSSSQL